MTQEQKTGVATDHTDKEMSRLEAYAKAQGFGIEEAATHLARSQLAHRYRNRQLAPAQVLQFGRMRRAEQVE